MSLQHNNTTLSNTKKYTLATVQQVYFQDVIVNGKKTIQKYSIICKIKNINQFQTRRYFGNSKFISIPKNGQLVYVWLLDEGYFWTKRFDGSQKNNLGLDYEKGRTIISGTNYDIINISGISDVSNINILSKSTTDDKFANIQIKGTVGNLFLMASQNVIQGARAAFITGTQKLVLNGGESLSGTSKKVNITGKQGIILSNDAKAQNVQPMVLGKKLKQWEEGLMDQINTFMGDMITQAQTAITKARALDVSAGAVFGVTMNLKKRMLFQQNKTKLSQILSKKNKVD